MLIRNLTPAEKRVIHIPDEEIGLRRFGTYVDGPSRPTEHHVRTPSPDPRDPIPARQKLDLPTQARATGLRIYDRRVDAWIAPPKPPIDVDQRQPKPSIQARSESGDPYWIYDRSTGARMRRICAQTPARAQQIAAEYALNHGLAASDAYAKKDD